jgi:hypothetical protein
MPVACISMQYLRLNITFFQLVKFKGASGISHGKNRIESNL